MVVVRPLGPVEFLTSGCAVDIGPPQRRLVPAAPAVDAGRSVPVETLVDRVWRAAARQAYRAKIERAAQEAADGSHRAELSDTQGAAGTAA